MGWTLLTVAAAAGGGLLLMRLRVPGGMLVGAILGAVLVNLTTGQAYIWPQTRVVAQVLTGAYIGCLVTTEDLRHLPRVIRPYLAVMSTFLALNLAVGFFIWRVTDLDLLTSLFCAAPGGMTDTPLIALDMGADASMVAVMQFVRMVFGMACLPSIIVLADRKIEGDQMVPEEGQGTHSLERKKAHVSLRKFLPTFAVALAAGILGKLSGVPAGTLSASLIAVIVLKFAGSAPPMPMWVRRLAQVVSGCCIGAGITRDQIFQLRQLILPALVLIAVYPGLCGDGPGDLQGVSDGLEGVHALPLPRRSHRDGPHCRRPGGPQHQSGGAPDMPPAWSDGHLSPDLRPALQFDRIKYAVPASIGGRHSFSAEQKDRPVINLPVWA